MTFHMAGASLGFTGDMHPRLVERASGVRKMHGLPGLPVGAQLLFDEVEKMHGGARLTERRTNTSVPLKELRITPRVCRKPPHPRRASWKT